MHSAALKRDEIARAIERVSQFADERSRAIGCSPGGRSEDSSSLSETGESEESVPSEYDGPDGDRIQRADICSIFCARPMRPK